jgi:hypothetical protein
MNKKQTRLTKQNPRKNVKGSVNGVLKESEYDDLEFDETAYDRKGREIHNGDVVIWTDPENGRKVQYRVYEEPNSEMVKMANKYGMCEAFPHECLVISNVK